MTEMSRFLIGKTFEEERVERQRRVDAGLLVQTFYDKSKDHWNSQQEVRTWFSLMFKELLLWHSGESSKGYNSHKWLPRTREQAMLLKLVWGGVK